MKNYNIHCRKSSNQMCTAIYYFILTCLVMLQIAVNTFNIYYSINV